MAADPSLHALLDRLAGDPASLSGQDRVDAVGAIEGLRRWLAEREAALLATVHAARDDLDAGARDLIQLQTQVGVGFGDAKRRAARATWFEDLPGVSEAVGSGALGLAQADDLCALAERLDPDGRSELRRATSSLLRELIDMTPRRARRRLQEFEASLDSDDPNERLDRQRRANRHCARRNADGTVDFLTRLDPISAAKVRRAVDAKVRELWRRRNGADATVDQRVLTNEQLRAEALVELIESGALRRGDSRGADVVVLIDYQTLLGELSARPVSRLDDGTPIPADAIRRLACEARVIPLVLGTPSGRIDVGRSTRLATSTQRVALRAIHDTCCVSGCDVPFDYCEIHHIMWWRNGGRTDLGNLAPVCSKHHHLIHENGWELTLDCDRIGRLARDGPAPRPAGRPIPPAPARPSRDVATPAREPECLVPMRC